MTASTHRRACEFHLLQYVPDTVRNEYVHIGVILRDAGAASSTGSTSAKEPAARPSIHVRFTRDWRRVRCLDPNADTALLEGMETELRRRFVEEPEGNLMRLLEES